MQTQHKFLRLNVDLIQDIYLLSLVLILYQELKYFYFYFQYAQKNYYQLQNKNIFFRFFPPAHENCARKSNPIS